MSLFNRDKHFVYFIREIDNSHFKIGYSKRPDKRVKQIQTGHPKKLGLFGLIEFDDEKSARAQEKMLHVSYQKHKTNGEWFKWCNGADKIMQDGHNLFKNYIRYFT